MKNRSIKTRRPRAFAARALLTVLLTALLLAVLAAVPAAAQAEVVPYPVTGGDIYFDKATGMITGSDHDVTAANIPASIDGVAVTGIEDTAFAWRSDLTSVTIPDSVTRIEDMAFYYCEKLASVTIGRGVYLIGEEAFACCHSLTSVTIPANVLKIGHWAFTYCENLKEIKVVEGNSAYSSQDGVLFNKDKTELIHYPGSKQGDYTVPGSVTSIGESAFCECAGLTGVTLPSGVTRIEEEAFLLCKNLASVTIPAHLLYVETYAFGACDNLEDVYYGGGEAQWKAISVNNDYSGNDDLLSARIHYYAGSSFSDMKANDWFVTSVNYAVANGLMQGVGNNNFAPNATLSRAMLVTILYRLEGEPAVGGSNPFSDVPKGSWYDAPVQWASGNGIVNGMGNNKFAPNNNITREQFAAILYRYAQFKGLDVSKQADITGYSDYSAIHDWGRAALSWANAEGLIQGRTATTLAPQGTATRAEAATILMRYLEK